jgi:uncharacterized protein
VNLGTMTLRQDTGFPDDPVVRLSVVSGAATLTLRVRVGKWVAEPPVVRLNGAAATGLPRDWPSGWVVVRRRWQAGDRLEVTMAMQMAVEPTPDHPEVQALTYGPVVLSAVHPRNPGTLTPQLEMGSISPTAAPRLTFDATVNRQPVTLLPIGRVTRQYYTTYFQMV